MEKPRKFINDSLTYILMECPYSVTVNKRHKGQFKKAIYSKYFEVSAEDDVIICALQQCGSEVNLECIKNFGKDNRQTHIIKLEPNPEETLKELLFIIDEFNQFK